MTDGHRTTWLFHATAMVPDYAAAFSALQHLIGIRVVYEVDADQPGAGYRGGAVWVGDNSIELGEPTDQSSPVARFVHEHGGGIHSFCVSVADAASTVAHLEANGVRHTPVFPPGFFFADPRDTGGVLLEAERAAGPVDGGNTRRALAQPLASAPLIDVTQLAFMGAIVDDPVALAHRFDELLDTSVTFESPGSSPDEPAAGVSLIDNTLALYPMPGERSEALWGRAYQRPRTHLIALRVDDLADTERRLVENGTALIRTDAGMIVVDPAATAGVSIAFVDQLLPGDPRQPG